MFDRRTVTAMLAGSVVAPNLAFAQSGNQKSAFYSGVGNELTHYEVDAAAATLAKRGSVKMPGGIQYAWPHPSKKYLYVTSSTGGPGFNPGPGFAPEALPLIFEPFRTTKANGLGLGLPICRSIINAHGGRLWAMNNHGRGATLIFTLPARNDLAP